MRVTAWCCPTRPQRPTLRPDCGPVFRQPTATLTSIALAVLRISFMTDLSGRPVSDADWHTELSPTTGALLHELGRHYAPFLVANAESLGRVSCSVKTSFWRCC